MSERQRYQFGITRPFLPILSVCDAEKTCNTNAFWITPKPFLLIPTRCRNLYLKQFCLEDIAPAVLIILITHIIVAVRWMLIKILSAVINGQRSHKVIVPDGCYLGVNIIRKIDRIIKMRSYSFCDPNSIFHTPTYPLLPK